MRLRPRGFFTLLLPLCILPLQAAEPRDEQLTGLAPAPLVAGSTGVYTQPVVLTRPTIRYPGRQDREALVFLELLISAEGKVTATTVLDSGFHEPRYVEYAEQYARGMTFRPATMNNLPVATHVVQPVRFGLRTTSYDALHGITPEFREELGKVMQLVDAGDAAGAHFHAEWMLREKVRLSYEYAVLHAQLADTHARNGNPHRAIEASRLATVRMSSTFPRIQPGQRVPRNNSSQYLLPREWIISLLRQRMQLAAREGLYREAVQSYYELASLSKLTPDAPESMLGEKLSKILQSDQQLAGVVALGTNGRWWHELSRRTFALGDIQGRVDAIRMRCGSESRELKYVPGVEWIVPASWENCEIFVAGESGTRFTIVEFPGRPPTAQPAGP